MLTEFVATMISDSIKEEAYDAFLAGSEIIILPNIYGFEVTFSGFSDILHVLIN